MRQGRDNFFLEGFEMYTYRFNGPSNKLAAAARRNLWKIGRVTGVVAKRRDVRRGRVGERYISKNDEVIVVYGTQGKAVFSGVCWGYGGSGPQAARDLLLLAGVEVGVASHVAFKAGRFFDAGIDWTINLVGRDPVVAYRKPNQAEAV